VSQLLTAIKMHNISTTALFLTESSGAALLPMPVNSSSRQSGVKEAGVKEVNHLFLPACTEHTHAPHIAQWSKLHHDITKINTQTLGK
jgi:hypothetical protein